MGSGWDREEHTMAQVVPAQASDDAAARARRVFVGGLPAGTTADELRARLAPFGAVDAVEIIRDDNGAPRGFAYVSMNISQANLQKAASTYGKARWRGSLLRVQEAREAYLSILQREWAEAAARSAQFEGSQKAVAAPAPFDEASKKGREGWSVDRYGRTVPVLKLRRRDGKRVVEFDPTKQPQRIKRLRIDNCPELPLSALPWSVDGQVARPRAVPERPKPSQSHEAPNATAPRTAPTAPAPAATRAPPHATNNRPLDKRAQANQRRLEAIEQKKAETRRAREAVKTGLSLSLSKRNQPNDDVDEEMGEEATAAGGIDEAGAERDGAGPAGGMAERPGADTWLGSDTDSGDESGGDEARFAVRPVFEGRAGADLLRLQRRIGSDPRFRMDDRFAEDASDGGADERPAETTLADGAAEEGVADEDLSREKQRALEILGEIVPGAKPKPRRETRPLPGTAGRAPTSAFGLVAHYDPTRADAAEFEITAEQHAQARVAGKKRARDHADDAATGQATAARPAPEVSGERFVDMALSLSGLFGRPGASAPAPTTPFSLLGDKGPSPQPQFSLLGGVTASPRSRDDYREPPSKRRVADEEEAWRFEVGDDSAAAKDAQQGDARGASGFGAAVAGAKGGGRFLFGRKGPESAEFRRTESLGAIAAYWESQRKDLTRDFKEKRRTSVRRQQKMARRRPAPLAT